MKNNFNKKNGKKINPIVAGAAGMAVGAGIAAALSDKKTKEKLGKVMGDIRSRVSEYMEKEHVGPKVKKEIKQVKKAAVTAGKVSER
jgi:hypothetical protein